MPDIQQCLIQIAKKAEKTKEPKPNKPFTQEECVELSPVLTKSLEKLGTILNLTEEQILKLIGAESKDVVFTDDNFYRASLLLNTFGSLHYLERSIGESPAGWFHGPRGETDNSIEYLLEDPKLVEERLAGTMQNARAREMFF